MHPEAQKIINSLKELQKTYSKDEFQEIMDDLFSHTMDELYLSSGEEVTDENSN